MRGILNGNEHSPLLSPASFSAFWRRSWTAAIPDSWAVSSPFKGKACLPGVDSPQTEAPSCSRYQPYICILTKLLAFWAWIAQTLWARWEWVCMAKGSLRTMEPWYMFEMTCLKCPAAPSCKELVWELRHMKTGLEMGGGLCRAGTLGCEWQMCQDVQERTMHTIVIFFSCTWLF